MSTRFISGNEAVACGVRLARPHVVAAYPITPQTTIVEALAQMKADGELFAEYIHVESEHSALSAALGASMSGARTFTATSSQGLLYMAEVLSYAAGGRFPIVMANANRATALPWNIYGDQRDSIGLLDQGWIQAYAASAQEALDLVLLAYRIAEDARVATPFMVNLDGFALTHTYETVDVPDAAQADAFLPPYATNNRFDFDTPKSIGYSAGPAHDWRYKREAHEAMLRVPEVRLEAEREFARIFGRVYTGGIEAYRCEDAEVAVVTLGSVAGLVASVVDELREEGVRAGLVRLRYLRPLPKDELCAALWQVKRAAVLEKDVSFGAEGTVFTNVNSALQQGGLSVRTCNRIGGLGGADISASAVRALFAELADGSCEERPVAFIDGEEEGRLA